VDNKNRIPLECVALVYIDDLLRKISNQQLETSFHLRFLSKQFHHLLQATCYLTLFGASTASAFLAVADAASLTSVAAARRGARNPLATAPTMSSPAPVTSTTFLPAPTLGRAAIAAYALAFALDEVSAPEAAWVDGMVTLELDVRTFNVGMAGAVCGEIAHGLTLNGGRATVQCSGGSNGKEEGNEGEELHG
jgi:hypothetical protein